MTKVRGGSPSAKRTAVPGKSSAAQQRAQEGREWRSIDLLREILGQSLPPGTRTRPTLGIGDDAAVLRQPGGTSLVWTIDGSVEDVHFSRRWLSLSDIGRRATHAAVSDVAAMGARPIAALCHLVLPPDLTSSQLRQLGAGQAEAARELNCPVIGGNISSGPHIELATTVLGEVPAGRDALTRSGARPGDEVWLVGDVGRAAGGLRILQAELPRRGPSKDCVLAWRRPRALVDQGLELQGRATSCIDISDGLVGDAGHLASSSDRSLVFDAERLRPVVAPLEPVAACLGVDAWEWVLRGGEDYALLATGPQKQRPRFARVVGRVETGAGVWLEGPEGRTRLRGGYQHLR